MSKVRDGGYGLALLILALLLAGCVAQGDGNRPPSSGEQAGGAAGTVALPAPTFTPEPPTAIPTATPTPTPPAPLAARVNGQYIFLADFEGRLAQYEQVLIAQGIDLNTDEGQEYLAQARSDVLEGLIDAALIEQEAAALGIQLTDAELDAQVQADIEAGGGQAAFDEWLQVTGQTRDDYKQMLRQTLLTQKALDLVTESVGATAEQVRVRHLLVATEEEAQAILAMLAEGADFVALAQEHSQDLATRDSGGDLGWFPRGVVAPELEQAAFALQPGQVSEPVRFGEGLHLIYLEEREADRPLSPEMQLDIRLSVFGAWLADLRAAADVERFVGE